MNDRPFSIRSSWNAERIAIRGPLTDRKIEKYAKQGWYSAELKEMRRERNAKRMSKNQERDGNYLKGDDGRMIYSPI